MCRRPLLLALAALPLPAIAAAGTPVTVWRDPSCGCCEGWVAHLRAEGFAVEDKVVGSVAAVRRMLGTPSDLLSCHAARMKGRCGPSPKAITS